MVSTAVSPENNEGAGSLFTLAGSAGKAMLSDLHDGEHTQVKTRSKHSLQNALLLGTLIRAGALEVGGTELLLG
jgi:hypothetical protein